MPNISKHRDSAKTAAIAEVFAALGDDTRLAIVNKLQDGADQSISNLAEGFLLTRQGVSRHLDVLTKSGLVTRHRVGRETRFKIRREQLDRANSYLTRASKQWDETIARLNKHIES